MKCIKFFADYANGVSSAEENYARILDLVTKLADVHPLFAQFSCKGRAGGWRPMEAEPLLKDVTPEYWLKELNRRRHDVGLSTSVDFWNRRRKDDETTGITCVLNALNNWLHNQCYISYLWPPFFDPEIMDGIARAFIDSFKCYRVQYVYFVHGPDRPNGESSMRTVFYQLWTKDGTSFPKPGEHSRYPADHPAPSISEPWHGGTRYSWPENDPRIFFAAEE